MVPDRRRHPAHPPPPERVGHGQRIGGHPERRHRPPLLGAGLMTVDPMGMPALYAPPRNGPSRTTTGRVIWEESYLNNMVGTFNDGIGSAHLDWDVIAPGGGPSVRLDNQGVTATPTVTGGNVQLVLGGSPQTITTSSNSTLVGTSAATGSPAGALAYAGLNTGYIVVTSTNATVGNWATTDGNSYVMTYTSYVVSGSANAWVVTFSGVNILPLPQTYGLPTPTLTTANVGTGLLNINNPNPNPTGAPQPTVSVVHKRRINDQFSGVFGAETWFRPTSVSSATSGASVFAHRLYNRNGVNYYGATAYPQFAQGFMRGGATWWKDKVLLWGPPGSGPSGAACQFIPVAFSVGAFGQHSWDPVGTAAGTQSQWDKAGCWNYSKIIVNM